ncbi:MAG: TonB-dependent receptor [Hyphomonadaceae bacterium]|nr:TonB-dependent receptor [Hyphomonadaceae bacterium]
MISTLGAVRSNRLRMRGTTSFAALAASAWLCGGTALAQTPAAEPAQTAPSEQTAPEGARDVIVVTAQFREQNIQDTPLAISAFNTEMIEDRSITALSGISAVAPNVNFAEPASTFGPATAAFIRGVGAYDTNLAFEPGVGVYIDDVYFSTLHGSMLDLLDLERVEVLRGPQGTLAGQNSIGGALKLYTKKPGEGGKGYVQATYGDFDRTEIRAATDITLIDDQLWARISGTGVSRDGYVTRYDYRCTHPTSTVPSTIIGPSCKLGTEGGRSYVGARAALRWKPSDVFELNIAADYTDDESEAAPSTLLYVGTLLPTNVAVDGLGTVAPGVAGAYSIGGVPLGTPTGSAFVSYSPFGSQWADDTFSTSPYISYENYQITAPLDGTSPYAGPDTSQVDAWGVNVNADYQISDNFSVTSITAYRAFESNYSTAEGSPANVTLQTNRIYHWQVSEELRLNGSLGDVFDFTVGGYYFDSRSDYDARIYLPSPPAGLDFIEDDIVPSETRALFATGDWAIIEPLHLVGGVRYTEIEKSFTYGRRGIPGSTVTCLTNCNSGVPGQTFPTGGAAPAAVRSLNNVTRTYSDDQMDYRLALQYRWTPDLMTYVQYATGFKAGGVNPRPFFLSQAQNFGPETLNAYEVGLKSDFFDNMLRLNASAFVNKYEDILVTVGPCPVAGIPNGPAPTPVETNPCALPINAGDADVTGAELEATFRPTDALTIDATVGYLNFEYQTLSPLAVASFVTLNMVGPYVQELQYSIGAQYEFDLGEHGTLTPRIDFSHQDPFFVTAVNRPPFNQVPERDLVNARLTYKTGDQDWQAALEVTNLTDELYYVGIFDNRGSTKTISGRPGRPREWAITVRRNF